MYVHVQTPLQPYHPRDRHSATEMSWGASPNVLTIVSVCVSDREWLGDTEGALYWVDDTHEDVQAHTHVHTRTLTREDSELFLSLCTISHSLSPWRRETQSFSHSVSFDA